MAKLGKDFSVLYFWYHHMMPQLNREEISAAIRNGDYRRFRELQADWNNMYADEGMIFLPSYATLWYKDCPIGHIDLNSEEGFKLIDFEECECD